MKPLAKTITHALAAIGLAGAAISPVLAGEVQKMTIEVSTDDLDLGTAKGQKELDQRVEMAVRSVCRVTDAKTGTRLMSQPVRACLAKARADARQQVAVLLSDERRGG